MLSKYPSDNLSTSIGKPFYILSVLKCRVRKPFERQPFYYIGQPSVRKVIVFGPICSKRLSTATPGGGLGGGAVVGGAVGGVVFEP
jgi:hypothetical protein